MESNALGSILLTLIKGLGWFYFLMPSPVRRFFGTALGFILRTAQIRSDVIRQNLFLAFPGNDESQVKVRERLYVDAYRHLGDLFFDISLVFGPMPRFIKTCAEIRGIENWRKARERGKGVIFVSSHVGNWEIMSAIGAIHGQIDLLLVTKRIKPSWFHRALESGRLKYGVKATYEPRTLKDVLKHLAANGTVGFVLDQYAGPPVGVRVPVFKVPVSTSTAIATLAKRTDATVLPTVCYRQSDGRWVAEIGSPFEWKSDSEISRELAINTAAYAARIEKDIYAHPNQWLWSHRRFKGDLSPLREGEWTEGRARC